MDNCFDLFEFSFKIYLKDGCPMLRTYGPKQMMLFSKLGIPTIGQCCACLRQGCEQAVEVALFIKKALVEMLTVVVLNLNKAGQIKLP